MVMLKTWIKILFLLALCVPIIYLQYCIIKNTVKGVFNGNKNDVDVKLENDNEKYYRREYLRVAK